MTTYNAHMQLKRAIGERLAPALREACEQFVKFLMPEAIRPRLTVDDVYKRTSWGPERIHSKRLLAELACEFDSGD